ncbi:MAG: hypothetical protein IJW33_02540 [Lentisphaeria bacterium]|nr:hypothetical protein [Lentisphaeria bacterium]
MKRICAVFPRMENFRERRPYICWEHMYGWLDGFGLLFDPVIAGCFEHLPLFSNGAPETIDPENFYLTVSGSASGEFSSPGLPGLFIRPPQAEGSAVSTKERITTPSGSWFYPAGFPYNRNTGNDPEWLIGDISAVKRQNGRTEVSFELFAMLGYTINEFPHERLIRFADMLCQLMELPEDKSAKYDREFRLDCQSFGIARLLLVWLLDLKNTTSARLDTADEYFLTAVKIGDQKHLKRAFELLAEIRQELIPIDIRIAEYPHSGIMFDDQGFFEMDWPEGSYRKVSALLDDVEKNNYRCGFEMGASCWEKFTRKFPTLVPRIRRLWEEGKIELSNGTWSLPYSEFSPLAMQYWQFQYGMETFKDIFGKAPELYQCQENAFPPQLPEFLDAFGYSGTAHVTQNQGTVPLVRDPLFAYTAPSGIKVTALGSNDEKFFKGGINIFLDLPLTMMEHQEKKTLDMFSMMDLSYIPLREAMIRTAKYAQVFCRFVRGCDLIPEKTSAADLPEYRFTPEDYCFAQGYFYNNYTHRNAFSQLEDIYILFTRVQAAQRLFPAGEEISSDFLRQLCTLEAHDCQRVQGQRTGEFYFQENNEVSPSGRKTLADKLNEIKSAMRETLQRSAAEFLPEKTASLANVCNSKLSFARVNFPERYCGKLKNHGVFVYAAGNFTPCSTAAADHGCADTRSITDPGKISAGSWQIALDGNRIIMERQGKRSVFSAVDSRSGELTPVKSSFSTDENWITAEITLISAEPSASLVTLRGITTADAEYIDWQISTIPGEFSPRNRWENYLALSFECNDDSDVKAFTPNLRHTVKKARIYSAYFLQLENFSLLFDAVKFFHRHDGRMDFLFHVADETIHQRRITVDFSTEFPLHRSRALATGLFPADEIACLPPFETADVSVEAALAPDRWLISNLSADSITPKLPETYTLTDLKGSRISALMPAQCALLCKQQ